MTTSRFGTALFILATSVAVSCGTASAPVSAPSITSDESVRARMVTQAFNFELLPEPFLKRLVRTSIPIAGLPSTYKNRIGLPAIEMSTGTFVLMDKTTITNRKWKPPLAPTILDIVPSRYNSYINSNAYLMGIDPATLGVALPQTPIIHTVPMPIRKQSQIRLSCVAHASVAAMEIRDDVPNDLSEQYAHHVFLQNLATPTNCCKDGGPYVLDAPADLETVGIPLEAAFPYTEKRPACSGVAGSPCLSDNGHDPTLPLFSPRYRVISVGEIPPGVTGPAIGNAAYLETILEAGFNIVIEVAVAWIDDKAFSIIPVLRQPDHNNEPMPEAGYHAMLLTGYDRDNDFFIARNSMGRSWGLHNGEAWLSYEYVTTYAVAGFIITDVKEETGQ